MYMANLAMLCFSPRCMALFLGQSIHKRGLVICSVNLIHAHPDPCISDASQVRSPNAVSYHIFDIAVDFLLHPLSLLMRIVHL